MTAKEIFAKIKARMLEGMVFHDEMIRYYEFLGLEGYAKCHEHHYREESEGYRDLCHYFMTHYNMLIPTEPMQRPEIIPEGWYQYNRHDVDKGTKQSAVKAAMDKWVEWERGTKSIFQDMYLSMIEEGEPAAAKMFARHVCDVDRELEHAEKAHIKLDSVGYDLITVITEQDDLYKKYK